YPGRRLCGAVKVADIGIPAEVLDDIAPRTWENLPALWAPLFPKRRPEGHKYHYGHVLVAGGAMTGAARLSALAALRSGAGLVSVAAREADRVIYSLASPSLIVRGCEGVADYQALLADERFNALVVGPGLGRDEAAWELTQAALSAGRAALLDADAVTA